MARFPFSGTNWEGRSWVVHRAIRALGQAISAAYPTGHPTDGTVASKQHDASSPNSQHRPYPYDAQTGAVVRAIDIGVSSIEQGNTIVNELIKQDSKRIRYLIFNKRIWSADRGWRAYSGYNAHSTHLHVSVLNDASGSSWTFSGGGGEDEMKVVDLQKVLNAAGWKGATGKPLAEDGIYGPNTEFALTNALKAVTDSIDPLARSQAKSAAKQAKRANDRLDAAKAAI